MSEWIDDPDIDLDKQCVPCGHLCDDDDDDDDDGWMMLELHAWTSMNSFLRKHSVDASLVKPRAPK